MRIFIFLFTMLALALPANAFTFQSVDERARKIQEQLEGNQSYDACLARKLASIARAEKAHPDLESAHIFIRMAEEHAAKAMGGEK